MTYKPKFIYTIYDPHLIDSYKEVETVHADVVNYDSLPCLIFKDDRGAVVAIHNLAPGHSISWTDQDGYAPHELER